MLIQDIRPARKVKKLRRANTRTQRYIVIAT